MANEETIPKRRGGGKKGLAQFSSTRFSLTQARNDSQQLFQLVLMIMQPERKAQVSIALCGALGAFWRVNAKVDLEKPSRIHSEKMISADEQAHLISGLFPGKFQVFLRSI